MLVRIISALVGCAIIIPVLIFSDTWIFPVFMSAVTALPFWCGYADSGKICPDS